MPRPPPSQFRELARYYDLLTAGKDYAGETRALRAIVRRYGPGRARTWLDVACGTGRHLEFLRRSYSVTGLDFSPEMLRIARRRLPGVPLIRGDLRTVRLRATFDVVSCLFSAIGHLRSERELRSALAHLVPLVRPGGLLIIEPWIDPREFRAGFVHLVSERSPAATVVRLAVSGRQGARSRVDYHYLVAERGRKVRHVEVVDLGLLVRRERLKALMETEGLRTAILVPGLTARRGLLVGRRPPVPRPARGGAS